MYIPAESLNTESIVNRQQTPASGETGSDQGNFASVLESAGSGAALSAETSAQGTTASEETGTASGKAAEFLSEIFNKTNSGTVSEEELYAAVTYSQLAEDFGQDAADAFKTQLVDNLDMNRRADGYTPIEQGVLTSLQQLIDSGTITQAKAETLNGEAFIAAQLDSNSKALWDHLGSTQAVAQLESALASSNALLDKIASGEVQAAGRTLTLDDDQAGSAAVPLSSASGQLAGAADSTSSLSGTGIIWKPISESDHKLVVVLPSSDDPQIRLYSPDGTYIETGDDKGLLSESDSRRVYRFNLPGAGYQDGTLLQVGGTTYRINSTASRYN